MFSPDGDLGRRRTGRAVALPRCCGWTGRPQACVRRAVPRLDARALGRCLTRRPGARVENARLRPALPITASIHTRGAFRSNWRDPGGREVRVTYPGMSPGIRNNPDLTSSLWMLPGVNRRGHREFRPKAAVFHPPTRE